jgi:hypothetical protein
MNIAINAFVFKLQYGNGIINKVINKTCEKMKQLLFEQGEKE